MYMNYEKPTLKLYEAATDREIEIAQKYTRVTEVYGDPIGYHSWLVVGSQYFNHSHIPHETRGEAEWHCWMLAKAICTILEKETA